MVGGNIPKADKPGPGTPHSNAVGSYGTRRSLCGAPPAGSANMRPADLRHFHATILLQEGTNLNVVQERLGHADACTPANVYSHVAPTMQRQAADAFSEAMDRVLTSAT